MTTSEKIGAPGPFEVRLEQQSPTQDVSSLSVVADETPRRRYDCSKYQGCLELAAALNWDSFTCRGCNETINDSLLWRARQSTRKCSIARLLCKLPPVQKFTRAENSTAASDEPAPHTNT